MHTQTLQVTMGCLLKDYGVIARRAGGQGGSASQEGYSRLKELLPGESWQPILDCVRWHEAPVLQQEQPAPDSAAWIVCAADRLADGTEDQKKKEAGEPLAPVFTHLNGHHPGWSLAPQPMDEEHVPMPAVEKQQISTAQYGEILRGLEQGLKDLKPDPEWVNILLGLMEQWTSFIPAESCTEEEPDISLFDHLKITAAIGSSVSEYMLDRGITDGREFLKNEEEFRKEQVFLLYSADFSGIQKFIYTVSTSGALRSLRSRSFFLNLVMEHYIDEILEACGLSRASLLYSGGGHCYLLLPNTETVKETLRDINGTFNDWLLDEFGSRLFLAHGWTACCGNDLINVPASESPYKAMFRRVSSAVSAHKLHRYNSEQIRRYNSAAGEETGRECRICGRTDRLSREDLCPWCQLFEDLSGKIQTSRFYLVTPEEPENYDFVLPAWKGQAYFTLTDEEGARKISAGGEPLTRIYTRNRFCSDLPCSIRFHTGGYSYSNDMETLAGSSSGIERLGVCRMDVDDLGQAFVAGFEQPGETEPEARYRYVKLTRTIAFSRQMSLFFQCWIDRILEGEKEGGGQLAVTIVYSGGDDLFLVGAWNDVIEASERIREAFTRFTCGALTISGGITLFDAHFPIRIAANQTAELEDRAKQEPGKNAISLFDPGLDHTYSWDTFRGKVMGEKHETLMRFFTMPGQERGTAFLYRLMELLEEAQEDRINLARYAYLLSRMEPERGPAKEEYGVFADRMYRWALDPEDRGQLITAIQIYLYQIRKDQ